MYTQSHLVIGLQVLGNTADAAIMSVGAAYGDIDRGIVARFEEHVSLASQSQPGGAHQRRIDNGPFAWFMDQPRAVRSPIIDAYTNTDAAQCVGISEALASFRDWAKKTIQADTLVWGDGAECDLAIVLHAFKQHGIKPPWKFWNAHCYRTMRSLYPHIYATQTSNHIAVDDACNELDHLLRVLTIEKERHEPHRPGALPPNAHY